jgi:ELWxxDGT repeat protein
MRSFAALALLCSGSAWAQAFLVDDLYAGDLPQAVSSSPSGFTQLGPTVFFRATDEHGTELWRTDGTPGGTSLFADINPGENSSNVSAPVAAGSSLFFCATTPGFGTELWVSDGVGVRMVRDFNPGPNSGCALAPIALGSRALFFATDGVVAGELAISDGVTITPLKAFIPSFSPYYLQLHTNAAGTMAYFGFQTGSLLELWQTDGTVAGTVKVTGVSSANGVYPIQTLDEGGTPAVIAYTNAANATNIYDAKGGIATLVLNTPGYINYHSMGAVDAGVVLTDLNTIALYRPGFGFTTLETNCYSCTGISAVVGDTLYYDYGTYNYPYAGMLMRLDPAGPQVALMSNAHFARVQMLATNGQALYGAWSDGTLFRALPASASLFTTAGTSLPYYASLFVGSNGTLLLAGSPVQYGPLVNIEPMYVAPGSVTVNLLQDIAVHRASSNPRSLARSGASLFFEADDDAGTSLYELEAVDAGPHRWATRSSLGTPYTPVSGSSGLLVQLSVSGQIAWATVDRDAGLVYVDRGSGAAGIMPGPLASLSTLDLYAANNDEAGRELFATDGTPGGSGLVLDIRPGPLSSDPLWLTASGNLVYFAADDGTHGTELWASDGTPAGTRLVADINAGPTGSLPRGLAADATGVFFVANDGVHGDEVWHSDGTAAGTTLVVDLVAGAASSEPGFLTVAGSTLFCIATDAQGEAIYALKQGTATRIADRGVDTRTPLLAVGLDTGDLLFAATSALVGVELFRSHGAAGDVMLVQDLNPAGDSSPSGFQRIGGLVYFEASAQATGRELYRFDATGVTRLTDIAPDGLSSSPGPVTQVGKHLLFAATAAHLERELWGYGDTRLTDNTPPVIRPSLSAGAQRRGWYTAPVTVSWQVSDDDSAVTAMTGCMDTVISTDTPGQTVTCSATSEGGTSSKSVTVQVDLTPPTLHCPADVTVRSLEALAVSFDVTATDTIDPAPNLQVNPPSGSLFPTGSSPVEATAVDFSGNQSSCVFNVNVLPPQDTGMKYTPGGQGCAAAPGAAALCLLLALTRRRRR